MRNGTKTIIVILLVCNCSAMGQLHPTYNPDLWNVLFQDDFLTFNPTRWYKCNNAIHGNEPQIYMDSNAYISESTLILKTEMASTPVYNNGQNYLYTSGQIMSTNMYKYGYYEIRTKLPVSPGYWPAFWFWAENDNNQNPWYNEIDVFEADGAIPHRVTCAMSYSFNQPLMDYWTGIDTSYGTHDINGYHWYGIEWDKDKIIWYYDQEPVIRLRNDATGANIRHAMTMIVNVALFPSNGNNKSGISQITIFPNYMYVDKINAYQLDCQDKNIEVYDITDFETYNFKLKKTITLSNATSLPSGSDVSLYATDYILLENNFTVPIGCEFYADTKPGCD